MQGTWGEGRCARGIEQSPMSQPHKLARLLEAMDPRLLCKDKPTVRYDNARGRVSFAYLGPYMEIYPLVQSGGRPVSSWSVQCQDRRGILRETGAPCESTRDYKHAPVSCQCKWSNITLDMAQHIPSLICIWRPWFIVLTCQVVENNRRFLGSCHVTRSDWGKRVGGCEMLRWWSV